MKSGGMRPKMARKSGGVPPMKTSMRSAMESVRPPMAKEFAAGGTAKVRKGQYKAGGKVKPC
jgi:hypothetical protein